MTRPISIVALLCVLLLTGFTLLLHASEYSNPALSTLLLPTADCPTPCFMGVQLGKTAVSEGIAKIGESPFIRSMSPVASYPSSPAPQYLFDVEFAQLLRSIQTARLQLLTDGRGAVIEGILLSDNNIQFGDILLLLDSPQIAIIDNRYTTKLINLVSFYPQYQLYASAVTPTCISEPEETQTVTIVIASQQPYTQYMQMMESLPATTHISNGWRNQLRNLRRETCT